MISLSSPTVTVPRKTYLLVWIALLMLLLLNWGLAQLNLGRFNLVATLAIPTAQMFLMIFYLMHVRYNPPLTRVFVAAGFIWFVILIDLTLSDYLTRGDVPGMFRKSWEHGTWPAPVKELPDLPPAPTPKSSSKASQ